MFVFPRDNPQQNGVSLLTVSDSVFIALSYGTIHFALHGSPLNHNLVETIPIANQRALCWWLLKLPWREKARYYLKEKKNLDRNCCQKWHYILLMAVSWKYKQWSKSSDLFKCKNNYYSFLHGLQLLKRIYFKRFWFQHGFSLLVSSVGLCHIALLPVRPTEQGHKEWGSNQYTPQLSTTLHTSMMNNKPSHLRICH